MKRVVATSSSPTPAGAYSQGIVAGPFVFVAGQGPVDPTTGQVPEGIAAQTRQVLRNVESILQAAGSSMDEVVKVTVHLSDLQHLAPFNHAYEQYFTEPLPVRTTVGSQLSGILLEIDVIAYTGWPDSGGS